MYQDGMRLMILGGGEQSNGQVFMTHGQVYTIRVQNTELYSRAEFDLSVDGVRIGSFVLEPGACTDIKGPPTGDRGNFTFFAPDTPEFYQAGGKNAWDENNGLVEIRAWHERSYSMGETFGEVERGGAEVSYRSAGPATSKGIAPKAGKTGLTGQNNQKWNYVSGINKDPETETILTLRLVVAPDPKPKVRPLRRVPPMGY